MMAKRRGMAIGGVLVGLLLVAGLTGAEQPAAPTAEEVGVPTFPKATYITSFKEGPAVRHLFATNAVATEVVRFYEEKTGQRAEFRQEPDGIQSYRIVRGDPHVGVPELEIRIERAKGMFEIPDERGRVQPFAVTIFVSRPR